MKHYVILKFKDRAATPEIARNAEEIFSETLSIPGVEALEIRRSCSELPNRFDLMIIIDMQPEVLPVYDASEPHQRWRKYCDPLLESKAIFDCE